MYTFKPRCQVCGVFCGYMADVGIPYGCKYTPDPEPLDEEYFCKIHAKENQYKFEQKIIENGEGEFRYCSWWQVPSFVSKALKKTGYKMVRNDRNSCYILTKV